MLEHARSDISIVFTASNLSTKLLVCDKTQKIPVSVIVSSFDRVLFMSAFGVTFVAFQSTMNIPETRLFIF